MRYKLMHLDKECLSFEISEDAKVSDTLVTNASEVPFYLKAYLNDSVLGYEIANWLDRRLIPMTRDKYERLKGLNKNLNRFESRIKIVLDNLAISLTDCYWVKKETDDRLWSEVNYFENNFENNLIDILIDTPGLGRVIDIKNNPSYALDGHLPKTWIIENGKRILLKAGLNYDFGESKIELTMSKILDVIGYEHIKYYEYNYKADTYSACECAIGNYEDFVSAYDFYIGTFGEGEQDINKLINILPESIATKLKEMITIDYVFFNKDRHWSNFGFIFDAKTCEMKRMFPIYDNGMCLYANAEKGIGKEIDSQMIYSDSVKLKDLCLRHNSKTMWDKSCFDLLDYNKKLKNLCIERYNSLSDDGNKI